MAAEVGKRARFQQQALVAQIIGQLAAAGRPQGRERAIRLAVHQIDGREAGGDLRPRGALQPVVDLMLQELGRLIEQIDSDQPVGEPPDHLVAAPADRGEVAEIIEQRERVDRRQPIALAGEEQVVECRGGLVLNAPRRFGIGMRGERGAHHLEGIPEAAFRGVEMREHGERLDLGLVAAPDRGQGLERADGLAARHLAERTLQRKCPQPPLRGSRAIPGIGGGLIGA